MAKRTKLAPTPRITKQKITAKDLLLKIRQVVLDEPQRVDLSWWVRAIGGREHDHRRPRKFQAPACGTVACLAGWGAVLLRPARTTPARLSALAMSVMRRAVGFGGDDFDGEPHIGGLFRCDYQPEFDETPRSMGRPGTVKHANTVARRIDRYVAAHPELATRVLVVKKLRAELAGKR